MNCSGVRYPLVRSEGRIDAGISPYYIKDYNLNLSVVNEIQSKNAKYTNSTH